MKLSTHPIQVYLDTSDYWAFATALSANSSSELISLYDWLNTLSKAGDIEIRYSIVHVCELVEHAPQHKKNAIARCSVMRDLTRDQPMIPVSSIMENELKSATEGATFLREHAAAEKGFWAPDFSPSIRGFRAQALAEVKNELRKLALPRKQRKIIQSAIFLPDGKITEKGMAFIRSQRNSIDSLKFEVENPLTERFYREGLLDQYFMGRVSIATLGKEMAMGVFRPDNLVAVYKDRSAKEFDEVFGFIRILGANIIGMIKSVQAECASVPGFDLLDKAQIRAIINRALPLGRIAAQIASSFEKNKNLRNMPDATKLLEICPSLKFVDALATQIIRYAVLDAKWTPPGSIGGDVAHATYIPYVDIWRGDGPFCELIKKTNIPTSAKIVRARGNLRRSIQEEMDKRRSKL